MNEMENKNEGTIPYEIKIDTSEIDEVLEKFAAKMEDTYIPPKPNNVVEIFGDSTLKMIEPNYDGIKSVLEQICRLYELTEDKKLVDDVLRRTIASPKFLYQEP